MTTHMILDRTVEQYREALRLASIDPERVLAVNTTDYGWLIQLGPRAVNYRLTPDGRYSPA